ncbi:MAG: 3-isopropylmalate dehydratase small subunit [Sulfitobacter sp.]
MTQTAPIPPNSDLGPQILHGVAVAFPSINIDTDAIFPKQFLKTIKRTGLEDALFADWRLDQAGEPNQSFVLNKPGFTDAKILIAGDNFGCGSSREHAVWALKDFGIKALISTSFGSIFQSNCVKNMIWPLTVSLDDLKVLTDLTHHDQPQALTVNLRKMAIFPGDGTTVRASVSVDDFRSLLSGLDEIDQTLLKHKTIDAFEAEHQRRFPWLT